MKFLSLLLFSLFQTCLANNLDSLPVFLIDSDRVMSHLNIEANPFAKMGITHFADIIHDAIKRSECVIIFVEDKLCSEDISLKDKLGSPFHRLHQSLLDKKAKYLPSVSQPYKTLTQIFHPQTFNVFYLSPGVKLQLLDTFKYLYIFFQDGSNETRAQSLRKHDVIMQEVYFTVRQLKPGPVIAFYTGKFNPIRVERLQFVPIKPINAPTDLGVMVVSQGALFRFSGVFAATPSRRSSFNQMPLIAEETWTRRKLSTTMAYTDFELQFNFSFGDDLWILDNVALLEAGEEVGRTVMGVGAPWNWSYVCGEPLSVMNTRDGSAITISKYQIQPIYSETRRQGVEEGPPGETEPGGEDNAVEGDTSNAKGGASGGSNASGGGPKCFGKSVNCGPYFNTNILSGLLISFICLAVLTYGVTMLYNCGNNDKYDDPNGKEVIVNTEIH